jgi:hypothetical protein
MGTEVDVGVGVVVAGGVTGWVHPAQRSSPTTITRIPKPNTVNFILNQTPPIEGETEYTIDHINCCIGAWNFFSKVLLI